MYEYTVGHVLSSPLRASQEGGEGVVGWWGVSMVTCNYRLTLPSLEVPVI